MNPLDFFSSMLRPWQWAVLLTVPPAIVALYFLKLKRQPLEVPSTYLWHRTIEDLHVNSIWQRLRQSILLLLQLLVLAMAILACLRPTWRGSSSVDQRYIFLVDTSASMSATDVVPNRLEGAKQQVATVIREQMNAHDVAMIISFSNSARVEQPFTDNKKLLLRQLQKIRPTHRQSDLDEVLRYAAGLANPGRSGEAGTIDVAAADALPATMFIYSDGGFTNVPQFAMGNLRPVYVSIGKKPVDNIGITEFEAAGDPDVTSTLQTFARIENFSATDRSVNVSLMMNDRLIDAEKVDIPAGQASGLEFSIEHVENSRLKLKVNDPDDFAIDNEAYAVVSKTKRAKVLVVQQQNEAVELVLNTTACQRLATTEWLTPDDIEQESFLNRTVSGYYDLIIFDRCVPKTLPAANTMFISAIPPGNEWTADEKQAVPQIIDIDRAHPLMQYVDLGDTKIAESTPLKTPIGGHILIDADVGAIAAIAPRDGFEDFVIGFDFLDSDLSIRTGFPVLMQNVLRYLGHGGMFESARNVKPGEPIVLRSETTYEEIIVEGPTSQRTNVVRDSQHNFTFGTTESVGVYEVRHTRSDKVTSRFTVNLFDSTESNIEPRELIETEYEDIQSQPMIQPTRREIWKYLILAAIVILIVEWYIYNQRVYI